MKITGIQQDEPSPKNTDKGSGQPTNWKMQSPIGSNKQGEWLKTYSLPMSWTLPESMALQSIPSLSSIDCIWSDRSYQARGSQIQDRKWAQCQNKIGYTYICIIYTQLLPDIQMAPSLHAGLPTEVFPFPHYIKSLFLTTFPIVCL